jgi:hypothetical protein
MKGGYEVIFRARTAVGFRDIALPVPIRLSDGCTLLTDVIDVCKEIQKVEGNKLLSIVNSRRKIVMEFKRYL